LVEKEKLDEIKKERMIKMVEDILTKKGEDKEFLNKEKSENGLNKILTKNLENIKKIAKKEGISINKLINILKQGE
jgi:signal transduction histidine kinase